MKKWLTMIAVTVMIALAALSLIGCSGAKQDPITPGDGPTTPGGEITTPGGDTTTPGGDTNPGGTTPGGGTNPGGTVIPDDSDLIPTEGLEYDLSYDGSYYTVSGIGTATDTEIVIGNSINGTPIKFISSKAFQNCKSITGVTICRTVTIIGASAFENCDSLKSVIIPDSVTGISKDAFRDCDSLVSVTMGDGIESIPERMFSSCDALPSITIPNDTVTIGKSAFSGCSALSTITMGSNVKNIGTYSFYNTSILSVTIPSSVTSIGEDAFHGCYKLIEVYNKSKLIITAGNGNNGCVGYYAKNVYTASSGASKLTSDSNGYIFYVNDGAGEYYLMGKAWSKNPIAITLPTTINSHTFEIYDHAFANCKFIAGVTIPSGITTIGDYAFGNCTELKNATIPGSVAEIPMGTFSGCNKLESITVPYVGGSKKTATDTYQYPFGYIFGSSSFSGSAWTEQNYYGASLGSATFSDYYVPISLKNVTVTGGNILCGAFQNCANITTVTLPADLTAINEYAFEDCDSIQSIIIPGAVQRIGRNAFYHCSSLENVMLGSGVTHIESYAFSDCRQLTAISVPDSLNIIESNAFNGSNSLQYNVKDYCKYLGNSTNGYVALMGVTDTERSSYTIDPNTKFINEYAFEDCADLTSITIPSAVRVVGDEAFEGCDALSAVYITDIVAWCNIEFSDGASYPSYSGASNPLYYAEKLYLNGALFTECTVPGGVTKLQGTFINCKSLQSISFSEGLVEVGDRAFLGCTSLGTINLPYSVKKIGNRAFEDCDLFYSFNLYGQIEELGEKAFYGCDQLNTVNLGGSITKIGDYVFNGCVSLETLGITNNLSSVGYLAFYGCDNLRTINFSGTVSEGQTMKINCLNGNFTYGFDGDYTMCCTDGSIAPDGTVTYNP